MNNLLPYEDAIHVLFRVESVLIVGVVFCSVLLQRQVNFAKKRAGDPKWDQWMVYPKLLHVHRSMFPGSWLRRVALSVIFLFVACMFTSYELIHRDQVHLDLYRASLIAHRTQPGEVR